MVAAMRAMVAVAVLVIPGAFVAVLAFLAIRTVRQAWIDARSRAVDAGAPKVPVREILSGVNVKSLVREARAVAF